MPQYLYNFDVCVIPFKLNPITEATDPVKLYEYLSGGKPVVSAPLPELAPYRDHLYIAENGADFAAKIDRAISEDNRGLAEGRKRIPPRPPRETTYQPRPTAITPRP